MDKLKTLTLLAAAVLGSNAYAGASMKELSMPVAAPVRPPLFVTAEGAYTWNSIGNTTVNGVSISNSDNNWGYRFAAGATHYSTYNPYMSYTGEMGWGYYGKTDFNSAANGVDTENQIYGVDLLVGASYRYNLFDLFFKVGGMIENVRMNRNTNLDNFVNGNNVTGSSNTTTTNTTVVPEIKLGGVYNFTDQWGVSLAYMYVFGNSNVKANISKSFDGTTVTSTTRMTGAPVALSSLMLGLRYSFA